MRMTNYLRAAVIAFAVAVSIAPAQARDAVVIITMAGEAYKGAPRFNFGADGRVLGTRKITNSVDTKAGKALRLRDGSKPPRFQKFIFKVPDIDNVSHLDIEFTNDSWAGKGKPGDRNLYVLALSLSTVEKTQTGFTTQTYEFTPPSFKAISQKADGSAITSEYAALYHQGLLRLNRPPAGWGSAGVAQNVPATNQQETVATSGLATSSPSCAVSSVELKGFGKNATGLSPAMQEQLATLATSLQNTSCVAKITAFAAGGPSKAFRANLSMARAQEVAKELTRLGLSSEKIQVESAKGSGRRVVITIE